MSQAKTSIAKNAAKKEVKRIDPMFNEVFVRVFGREESRDVTREFINAVFRKTGIGELGEIESIHAEYTDTGEAVGCKAPRFDVLIIAENQVVNIEAERHDEDFGNRALLYASRLMGTYTKEGVAYDELPQVVVIVLLDTKSRFNADDSLVFSTQLNWRINGCPVEATDRMKFVLLDMHKARKRYNSLDKVPDDELATWMYVLASGYRSEREMEAIMERFPGIEEFAKQYGKAIDDPELVATYEHELWVWREQRSFDRWVARKEREAVEEGLAKGLEEGLAKGLEQGLEQGRAQGIEQSFEQSLALLKEMGMSDEFIVEFKRAYQDKVQANAM